MEMLCICLVCSIDVMFPAHLLARLPACGHYSTFPGLYWIPFCQVSHSLAVKQRQLCSFGQEKGVISELRPSQRSVKAGLMTGSFFLPRAGFRWEQLRLGHSARIKNWCARSWAKFVNSASHSAHCGSGRWQGPSALLLWGTHVPASPAQEPCWPYQPLGYTSSEVADTHTVWFPKSLRK